MNICITIKTQFEALHSWPGCDIPEVDFLRHAHRHIFHVKMKWEVKGLDRAKEFIMMKRRVNRWIDENWEGQYLKGKSCEMMVVELMDRFNASYVEISEDGENGAEVTK